MKTALQNILYAVVVLVAPAALAQVPARVMQDWQLAARPTASAACDTVVIGGPSGTFDNTITANRVTVGRHYGWWVTNTAIHTICAVEVAISNTSPSAATWALSVAIYASPDNNPTNITGQIGGNSDWIGMTNITSGANTTNRFTWSSNHPVAGTSNYWVVLKSSAVGDTTGTNEFRMRVFNPAATGVATLFLDNMTPGNPNNRRPWYRVFRQ